VLKTLVEVACWNDAVHSERRIDPTSVNVAWPAFRP
jgi:hypothetical protein